jgi:hypothetical protein
MLEHDLEGPEAYRATAGELVLTQRAEEAEAVVREGLRRYPGDAEIQSWLAHAVLMQGRWREGFREFESRMPRREIVARRLATPEWDGPIAGRSIMVWGEQGIGDEIQTVRFVRDLRALGASKIYVACSTPNVRAFEQFDVDQVIDRSSATFTVPRHDYWVKAWSIPYRLGLDVGDISGAPYLKAPATRRGGVGLVERGNPNNPRDACRSMPDGLLQALVPQGELLQPVGDTYDSLCRLAGLDLLITVDTSWAHMAGALGVPCWLLLPFRHVDWRWMRRRTDTPWYDSVRLFRQPSAGDWASVLQEVDAALADFVPIGRVG